MSGTQSVLGDFDEDLRSRANCKNKIEFRHSRGQPGSTALVLCYLAETEVKKKQFQWLLPLSSQDDAVSVISETRRQSEGAPSRRFLHFQTKSRVSKRETL